MTTLPKDIRLMAAALAAAGDAGYDWDLTTDTLAWSDGAKRLFKAPDLTGFSDGASFSARINPDDLSHREQALAEHYRTRATFDCEYRVRQADGLFCWVHDRGSAVFAADGRPARLRGVLRPVTGRKEREARLERSANYDVLTGHFNRSRLREAVHHALLQSRRYGEPGAYLSVGINALPVAADAGGRAAADAVIVAAGLRLERMLRTTDVMGRVDEDVYGAILGHCPEREIGMIAERILRSFREEPIDTPAGPVRVSVSIGGICFPSAVQTGFEAMSHSEAAMREAKQAGGDGFSLYRLTEEQERSNRAAMAIGEQLKEALRHDRVVLAFQPVVAAGGDRVHFYECLARLRLPEGDLLPAGAFVPVAEQLGLIRALDRRVLELAVAELDANPELQLSLNISGFTATDQGWLRLLVTMLGRRPDIARRLIIEIAEAAAIQNIGETVRFIAEVRDSGCRVALDDFGAGFTALRHLRTLAIDLVKISGSFVRALAANPENRLFVETLVSLAKGAGLSTVAACVETAEDAALLAGGGVDFLQGYLFAKPGLERLWLQPHGGVKMSRYPVPSASRVPLQPDQPPPAAPAPSEADGGQG